MFKIGLKYVKNRFETYFKRAKPILNLFKPNFQPKIENQRGAAAEGRRPPFVNVAAEGRHCLFCLFLDSFAQ